MGPISRPTPPWTPTPETSPTPIVAPASCPDPLSKITYPGVNQTVQGVVEIRGTASCPAFQFYKVEFSLGGSASAYHVIDDLKYTPVRDGLLVNWYTGELSGTVTLRLTVVTTDGNYLPPCEVPVVVEQG
jgi:hypothetical protein